MGRLQCLVGLATLAGAMPFGPASPASADLIQGNVLTNGAAEIGTAATNEVSTPCPGAWNCSGSGPTFVRYGVTTFPSLAESTRIGGGQSFFTGGRADDTLITQTETELTQAARSEQAAGRDVYLTLSGCFGGWQTDGDNASFRVISYHQFNGNPIGIEVATTNPVLASDRQNETKLVPVFATGGVPSDPFAIVAEVRFDRQSGIYNDGYADNLTLEMSNSPAGTTPVDCDSSNDGGSGGGGSGDGGGGGGSGGGGTGDPGGGQDGGAAAGAATLGFARKATILARKQRLRTKLTCNTDRVERCEGTLSATVVKRGQGARQAPKPVAIGTYSVASLGTAKAKLDLTARGARKLAKLSDAKLARRAAVLSATTELGAQDATDSATLALGRKG